MKRIKWIAEYVLLKLLVVLSMQLSASAKISCGNSLGKFVYLKLKYRKEVVLNNLSKAIPDYSGSIEKLAEEVYKNIGATLVEFLSMQKLSKKEILQQVEFDGIKYLTDILDTGKPALMTTGHFGNWEMLAAAVNATGIDGHYVVRSQTNPYVDKLQNNIRKSAGLNVVKSEDIRLLVKLLRGGKLVGILPDVHAGADGVIVDFMGRSASTTRGLAYFSWKFNCPIVPSAIFRKPDGGFKAVFKEPIYPDCEMAEEEAVQSLTELHTIALEKFIQQQPDHYFWLHRRWKISD